MNTMKVLIAGAVAMLLAMSAASAAAYLRMMGLASKMAVMAAVGVAICFVAGDGVAQKSAAPSPALGSTVTIEVPISNIDQAESACRAACARQGVDWMDLAYANKPVTKTTVCRCQRGLAGK